MKSLFSKLLPFVFLAMLSIAPIHAQAAGNFGPSGPREGMFDCLGSLDWGCRIISFIFEGTEQGNDNSVTYMKDGSTFVDRPSPVLGALRAMMAFFSNALLIFASIKLLYELIQMTAESAQTGQVGGKDANKLWAPIRLVIAIGLLVPLDTGLNSGQYIVLQIAKWGSGMASQAWKLFAEKLSDGDALTTPAAPRIRALAMNAFKSYACQSFINYYAAKIGMADDFVKSETETGDGAAKLVFKNNVYRDICGYIRYKTPQATFTNTKKDSDISLQLTEGNYTDFMTASSQLGILAQNMAGPYLPNGRNLPKPTTENLEQIIQEYQDSVTDRVTKQNSYAKDAMTAITSQIQNAANAEGWTSAGTWFLAITRAQGQIINGAANLPEASGPNLNAFTNYGAAFDNYQEFVRGLNENTRPQDKSTAVPSARPSAGLSVGAESRTWYDWLSSFVTGAIEAPVDGLFYFLDKGAVLVGLWDSDPKKAFGDLGASTNPFGEIAALGHKKIRLALDFAGYAIFTSVGGGALDLVSKNIGSVASPLAKKATGAIGAGLGALAALLMMIATLFLLAGVLLAYIVPMFPYTRFFFSILTWLGSLIEAMVLVPFMALAFLTPKGEGFSGPNTRNAFFLIFQLFLRPILCLFGLMCAMIVFYIAAKFLNASFYEATSGVGIYQGSAMRFMQKLVYSVMYVGLIYSAANISFKMIEHFPKHALKWMGGSASEESYDDHSGFMNIASAVGGTQLLNTLQSLPERLSSPVTKSAGAWQQVGDTIKDKKRSNEATNLQLLSEGGHRDANKQMHEEGAVSLPQGTAGTAQQIEAATEERNQARQELREVEAVANGIEKEIETDAHVYNNSCLSGTPDAGAYSRIQANIGQLNRLGRSAPASALGLLSAAPTPPGLAAINNAPVALGRIQTLAARAQTAEADLAQLKAPPP